MTADEIRAAITSDPAILALMPDTVAIAAALSAGRTRLVERLITERRILSTLGVVDGAAFLSALEAFAAATLPEQHPLALYHAGIARAVGWLKTDDGIDIGDATSQAMLDALAAAGVVTVESAAIVKALARVPAPLSELDVRRAVFADDGSPLV
ncbi:MAG: hypothetical protein HEQ38_20535 [Gemmatimonas sp.]|nr:hypothetical protein [Gemmatimonas sp.]